ncbi:MAG TPA: 50S ribosomal protein L29 [Candidatus Berkiella sp.]|uniref:Large ribosomal subunit protein uL29 n=1 Tax=Candidatus Berkiella aquae TaxID=295108 RepID=A0A0Q9YMA0_9GAMM|nr:50S ribosomal protein L29 [Candidatus Berkiella aquae]MCS5710272.1 50S ribosomal protein L29 [Candidatus Berkiella aquae]HRE31674.1 50S ribosomal protein L29 [Candidatus Berkiella sp.]
MKANELRQQNKSTLQNTLKELVKRQFQLKMQHGSGQLATNQQLRHVRRDIARVKTVMTEIDMKGSKDE